MTGHEAIAFAFALSNALRLASYAPQIWRVARDRGGAQAISCLTWSLWVAANATTGLYAWTHLNDLMLTIVNAGNAVGCAAVLAMTLIKRSAHARASTAPSPVRPPQVAMHSVSRSPDPELSLPRTSAGIVAASIAAALIVGLVTLVQTAPADAKPAAPIRADGAPQHQTGEALDAGVPHRRCQTAREP